jgi:cyclic pyranopterin phosphate synthase
MEAGPHRPRSRGFGVRVRLETAHFPCLERSPVSTQASSLVDSYHRRFVYLRLSVTDRCNFRCSYCLPNGYIKPIEKNHPAELSVTEIQNLVRGFVELGVRKVRLTGGEPTVRRDLLEIAQAVARTPGIEKVGITTNGTRLKELARPLRQAGVTALNVSVDSLNRETFKQITGMDRLESILDGLEHALTLGFESVKINAVLLDGWNETELSTFMEWIRNRPVSVRFIELMETGHNIEFFRRRHISAGKIQFELLKSGWSPRKRGGAEGPAIVYEHPHYQGTLGLIAPYSEDFCVSCNRLRVSSVGALRLCLFGSGDASLRDLLQSELQTPELVARIRALVAQKPEAHLLKEGNYGNTWNLSSIGG